MRSQKENKCCESKGKLPRCLFNSTLQEDLCTQYRLFAEWKSTRHIVCQELFIKLFCAVCIDCQCPHIQNKKKRRRRRSSRGTHTGGTKSLMEMRNILWSNEWINKCERAHWNMHFHAGAVCSAYTQSSVADDTTKAITQWTDKTDKVWVRKWSLAAPKSNYLQHHIRLFPQILFTLSSFCSLFIPFLPSKRWQV